MKTCTCIFCFEAASSALRSMLFTSSTSPPALSRQQRRAGRAFARGASTPPPSPAAAEGPPSSASGDADASLPRIAKDAISLGLQAYAEKEFDAAADLFALALTLPGSGATRLQGSLLESACASDGEVHAALYNLACTFVQLQRKTDAVAVVNDLLLAGYEDEASLLSDADLLPVRSKIQAALSAWNAPFAKLSRTAAALRSGGGEKPRTPWTQW